MNIKKMITGVIVGASMLLSLAGTGMAAEVDINIHGASAQFLYWMASMPSILQKSALGCANSAASPIVQAYYNGDGSSSPSKSKFAITSATCSGNHVYVREDSKASFDGIYALSDLANTTGNGGVTGLSGEICSSGDLGDPGATLRNYYRKMVDETSCTFGAANSAPGTCTRLKCVPVTLAVSDVSAQTFTESSSGQLKGPAGGGFISRSFSPIPTGDGWNSYNPIVVPFAFYANTTIKRCPDGTPYAAGCAATISNMSRMMAVMIFSGQATDTGTAANGFTTPSYWTDLGGEFVPSLPIVACFRHAGSGTHATLDYAVMNGGLWGANVLSAENTDPTQGTITYFNDASGDEMNCIDVENGGVGYSDADQALASYPHTTRLTYNGEQPTRTNIRNGRYDFWTKEWAYENTGAPTYNANTASYISAMITFASDPSTIPTASYWGVDKTQVWASTGEMRYMKSSDQNYPGNNGILPANIQNP